MGSLSAIGLTDTEIFKQDRKRKLDGKNMWNAIQYGQTSDKSQSSDDDDDDEREFYIILIHIIVIIIKFVVHIDMVNIN